MRKKLIEALAMGWRYAENIYLEHHDSIFKAAIKDIQEECLLSDKETEELEAYCDSLGL